MIKISVIVPVYKCEKYIGKCIESLMNQTEKDIEIILVDDGSPDNSGKICDEYSALDNRIKVIHKSNGGVSSARNTGIENALGEYIVFVDSDDWVESQYVEQMVDAKNRYNNYEIMCGYKSVSKENVICEKYCYSFEEKESIVHLSKYMIFIAKILAQSPVNKLFDLSLIKEKKIRFDESLSLGEDMLFCLEYYKACKNDSVLCINNCLYNYLRTGDESLSKKYYPDLLAIDEKLYGKLEECIVSWGADEEQMGNFANSRFYRYISALENTYKAGNKATSKEKKKTNNNILRSPEFKASLKNIKSYIHPIHKIAYKSGSWTLVRIAYKITSLKQVLKRR